MKSPTVCAMTASSTEVETSDPTRRPKNSRKKRRACCFLVDKSCRLALRKLVCRRVVPLWNVVALVPLNACRQWRPSDAEGIAPRAAVARRERGAGQCHRHRATPSCDGDFQQRLGTIGGL